MRTMSSDERRIKQERTTVQTEAFMARANSQLRATLHQVLKTRKKLLLDVSGLSREERANVEWIMGGNLLQSADDRPSTGYPNSVQRPLGRLIEDWVTFYDHDAALAEKYADKTQLIQDRLRLNKDIYYQCQSQSESNSAPHLTDAFENMGFEANPRPYMYDVHDSADNIIFEVPKGNKKLRN
eukprot:TRINITY_DN66502_c4_g1_i1.p1 TRINITY_DN66502_c4_g1~~TRINITY_DN66502_c4_g1_i1.p1  ORF type:complete len:215 (+),score=126.09 TRINITY_DN66502_c4_g1_i1:99-647(+)